MKLVWNQRKDTIISNLSKYRNSNQFCDFEISVGEKSFSVHRVVVENLSPYFSAIFQPDFKESQEKILKLTEPVTVEAIEQIINYAYTSEIEVNENNLRDILIAANFLNIDEIELICIKYMKDNLSRHNCIELLALSEDIHSPNMTAVCLEFCSPIFEELHNDESVMELYIDLYEKFLASNGKKTNNYALLKKWIKHDEAERLKHLPRLLEYVNFDDMSAYYLCAVLPLDEYYDKIKHTAVKTVSNKMSFLRLFSREKPSATYESCEQNVINKIYAFGGWIVDRSHPIAQASSHVEYYQPNEKRWITLGKMNKPRFSAVVGVVGETIYLFGGHDGVNFLEDVEKFNIRTQQWGKVDFLLDAPYSSMAAARVDDDLHIFGGENSRGASDQHLMFNLVTNTMNVIQPGMKQKRFGACAASLGDKIYVIGGGVTGEEALDLVECYDTKTKTWTQLASLTSPRKHASCIAYENAIYVAGGNNRSSSSPCEEDRAMSSVEVYLPIEDRWIMLPPMNIKRYGLGLTAYNGYLYAIDGSHCRSIEYYDLREGFAGKWSEIMSFPGAKSAANYITLSGPVINFE